MESLNEGELQQPEEIGTNGHAEEEVKTTGLKEDTSTSTKALSVEHANDESETQAVNERSVRQTDDASETYTTSGEEVNIETEINLESKHQDGEMNSEIEINLESKHQDGEINSVNSKNNSEETDDKNNDRNDEEEIQRLDEMNLENENVEKNLNLDSSENILPDKKESGAELDTEVVEEDADKNVVDKKEELKEYLINDENGNFDEISKDLLVFKEKRTDHDPGDDDVYFSDRTDHESTNNLETVGNIVQGDLTETQMNEVTENMQENLDVDGIHVHLASEKSNVLEKEDIKMSIIESKNKHLEDADVLEENKQNDDEDDDEDGSPSTDTSNLANIIVKHVLDTAVSAFNNDTSFSSDDGIENDQELMSRESLTVKDEDKKQVKHSNEQDDMTIVKEMNNLSESSKISTSEQCLLSGEEDSVGNDVEFDENGNRRTPDQHYNPVAIEIAVAMVYDKKEATQNRVTDQIREDIQEISEHISLNDTVETEQNISKTIENDENGIHEILASEEDVTEQEEQSVEVSPDLPCGSQGLPELPSDSPCGSQGLSELPPLPNYPDFPINYGNYKVCRNLSPSEKECLIIETGEMVTCKDKLNSKTCEKIRDEGNKMRKFKPAEDLSEIGKESKICTRSNAPQQTMNNVSQDMFGSECTKSSSPHRNGESSFRIMKNDYDCKQRPVTSPRNDYEEKNFNRVQNVPASIDYGVDILPQSRYSEDNPEARIPRNQQVVFKRFGEQDFKLNRSWENQQLNNETDLRGRIQQNVLQSSSPRNIHQTNGDIDLSNPSVMVRYQRNILSQNLHQNFAHASLPTDSDHDAQSYNTPQSHSADFSNQSKGPEVDRTTVSPFYAKYGNSSQSRNMLGYSDAEGEFSASSESMSVPSNSGSVPSYRTLHEQQNTWMQMFKTLEEKHHLDLQQQNRLHKEALFNLQQNMEDELLDQQKNFRQKLTMHKEALSQSLNRSISPINSVYDKKKISNSRMNDSHVSRSDDNLAHSIVHDGTLSYQETFQTHNTLLRNQSPSWREIYKEIRGIDASDEEPSPMETTVRRSLDKDLTTSPGKSRGRTDGEGQKEQNVNRQTLSPREQHGHPDRPRAGVYSSPMPLLRGRGSNSQHVSQPMQAIPVMEDKNVNTCDKVTSPSVSRKSPSRQQHQQMLLQNDQREAELLGDSTASDDVYLSASSRVSLREKHAKHMSDLREYYEKELRDLKSSLLLDITEESPFKQVTNENQNLVIENRLLREKIEDLENELKGFNRKIRDLEQLNHGLEDKVKEYAENYGESQAKLSNFRSKMEELQYYFREKDETNQQLKYQVKHLSEKIRTSKKVSEKYEATEREHVIIREALNGTENKLYDAQTEIVNLKRNISKLELENKRLSRENDNLHNKKLFISDMNSCMHDSSQSTLPEYLSSPLRNTPNKKPARSETTSQKDDLSKGDNQWIERDGLPGSARDVSTHKSPLRTSAISHDESIDSRINVNKDNSQMSPIVKAEQDLYMLRDMMRQRCHSPSEPPKFKLKTKFYGSDIQTQTRNGEYSPVSSKKNHRRKSPSDSSPKTKSIKSRKPETASNGQVTNTSTPSKGQRSSSKINVNRAEFSSPTRLGFDIESNRIPKRQSGDGESRTGADQTSKKRSQPSNDSSSKVKSSSKPQKILNSNSYQKEDRRNGVEDTLDKVKAGEYVTRPEWENVFTSMTKPSEKQPLKSTGDKIRDRQSTITDLEQRYVELNAEKRKLESVLSRVPLHGKGRQEKERVEDTLDQVERELGSIRMSLKRYNVLKTCN